MLSFLLVGLSHGAAPGHSVAGRLYVLKGTAYVVGDQDQQGRLVQVCRADDTIQVGGHSVAMVWLMGSGLRYQLSSPSTVKIVNGAVKTVSGTRPKQLPKLSSDITKAFPDPTAQAAVQFRGGEKIRITPCGGVTTAPDALSWKSYPDAVSYDVTIGGAGEPGPAVEAKALTKTSISIPKGSLKPGRQYLVSLTVNLPNGGSELAFRSLRLLSSTEQAALARAEKALDARGQGSPDAELAKADLYEQYDLYRDTLKCLTRLNRTDPSIGLSQEIDKVELLAEGGS